MIDSPSNNPLLSVPKKVVGSSEFLSSSGNKAALENEDFSLSAYDYELSEQQIAQNPAEPRDSSRLLVVESCDRHSHHVFRDLLSLLAPGDLLILNNTRVIPARLYGVKPTGAPVEILLLEKKQHNCWLALVKPGKRLPLGAKILFQPQGSSIAGVDIYQRPEDLLTAMVVDIDRNTGGRILQFEVPKGRNFTEILGEYGQLPLPPYIKDSRSLPEQYQTVYADRPGAVAAPTAGLHFTNELLERLQQKGIERAYVTLHVGVGTFRPVEAENILSHQMHEEWVEVPPETVAKIRDTKAKGGRIIAVGTTAVRSLEGAAANGKLEPFCGKTELFIYPGYRWRVVEGLITNFHLPRSSLLMLVSALVGRTRLLSLYQEAIAQNYRFYSFGDAMLILPESVISH